MPALSFSRSFVDYLLRGDKQQTTRPQTDRFKVGGIAQIYIEQRRRITEKPLRRTTANGREVILFKIENEKMYPLKDCIDTYYAHFLGKVEITEVYDVLPVNSHNRSTWAKADGFTNFTCADTWFTARYGNDWMRRTWTVIKWNGWQERYFEAGEV